MSSSNKWWIVREFCDSLETKWHSFVRGDSLASISHDVALLSVDASEYPVMWQIGILHLNWRSSICHLWCDIPHLHWQSGTSVWHFYVAILWHFCVALPMALLCGNSVALLCGTPMALLCGACVALLCTSVALLWITSLWHICSTYVYFLYALICIYVYLFMYLSALLVALIALLCGTSVW